MTTAVRPAALAAAVALGSVVLGWPLFATSQLALPPAVTTLVVPLALAVLIDDLVRTDFDARNTAVLASLIALAAIARMVSPGVAGIEPIWVVLIVAGRALGAAAGFAIGVGAIATSALMTGGVGPWLPYQMILAGWIAMGAGWLPRAEGPAERWWLAGYGAVAGVLFGWGMNLWFWPSATSLQPGLALDYADSPLERLGALVQFSAMTSLGFDLPRAALTATLLLLAAPRLLRGIRRLTRPVCGIVRP